MAQKNDIKESAEYKAYLAVWHVYLFMQKKYDEEQKKLLQESVEMMQREIEKQDELNKKFEMMREHPEWFETTSPKQYGMNLNKRKYGRH